MRVYIQLAFLAAALSVALCFPADQSTAEQSLLAGHRLPPGPPPPGHPSGLPPPPPPGHGQHQGHPHPPHPHAHHSGQTQTSHRHHLTADELSKDDKSEVITEHTGHSEIKVSAKSKVDVEEGTKSAEVDVKASWESSKSLESEESYSEETTTVQSWKSGTEETTTVEGEGSGSDVIFVGYVWRDAGTSVDAKASI